MDWAEELLRTAAHKADMIEDAGGIYTTNQVASLLGISVPAMRQRIRRKSLLAVRLNNGEWGLSVVQFTKDGAPAGLGRVLRAFDDTDPWVQLGVLLSRDYGNGRIIEWIHSGHRLDAAERIARSYGHQTAIKSHPYQVNLTAPGFPAKLDVWSLET